MKRPPRRAASATVAKPATIGGTPGQTAAVSLLHDDHRELDHRGLADQVEAIRALLQSLRAVRSNVLCDRLSQTVGKRRACERWEARSRSERKRERVRRPWRCDAVAVMRERGREAARTRKPQCLSLIAVNECLPIRWHSLTLETSHASRFWLKAVAPQKVHCTRQSEW